MRRTTGHHIGAELRAMFPEQTRSIPVLLIWTVVYLLDAALVFWLYFKLGFGFGGSQDSQMVMISLLLIAALALLRVETFIYNKIVSLFR